MRGLRGDMDLYPYRAGIEGEPIDADEVECCSIAFG